MKDRPGWTEEFAKRYEEEGYWTGETFSVALHRWAQRSGDETALIDGDERLSCAELLQRSRRVASGLERQNADEPLEHVIVVGEVGDRTAVPFTSLDDGSALARPADRSGRDLALLLLAGGTTRLPKLIPRTHSDYLYNARRSAEVCRMQRDTVFPTPLPLANQRFRVVDGQGVDRPDWVAGDLLIGGRSLAEGRLDDDALTAERFVRQDDERWYRTADTGRYWPDGTLEFLGRVDTQVKVSGHRIELGDVEAAMRRAPGVENAVALVALVSSDDIGAGEGLNPAEEWVATVWSALLQTSVVSADAGFFSVGGNSLAALRFVDRVRQQWRVEFPVRALLERPDLTSVAEELRRLTNWRIEAAETYEEGEL